MEAARPGGDDQPAPSKGKQPVLPTIPPRDDTPQDTCVICLSAITERAVCVPCNHLTFDFLCLVSWLQEQPSCPLCKTTITSVQYDWRAVDDYKTYHVPAPTTAKPAFAPPTPAPAWQRGRPNRRPDTTDRTFPPYRPVTPQSTDEALARRRKVYALQAYSLHVGANRISEFRNFTPASFARTPALQSRARIFIRRELLLFSFLQEQSRREFLLEYVVGMLKKLDLKGASGAAEDLVAEFLGRDCARLFLHELEQWLRSPYARLEDWDRHVQYAEPGLMGGKRSREASRV